MRACGWGGVRVEHQAGPVAGTPAAACLGLCRGRWRLPLIWSIICVARRLAVLALEGCIWFDACLQCACLECARLAEPRRGSARWLP